MASSLCPSNLGPPSPPLAPQPAPFGARMGPIISGKVIHGGTLRPGPCSGWISVPRPTVPFVSVGVHTSLLSDPVQPGQRPHPGRPITAADVCGVWQRVGVASLAFCPVVAPEGSNVDFEI